MSEVWPLPDEGGTRTLTGTITTGYTLAAGYSTLVLTPRAEVVGVTGASPGGVGGVAVHMPPATTLSNAGTIIGGAGGGGDAHGGAGGAGVFLARGGRLFNSGVITGGAGGAGPASDGADGAGVQLVAAGAVENAAGGFISGRIGIDTGAAGAVTVTNFGTVEGTGGTSVRFRSSGDRLIVGAGGAFLGAARGGGGTLELASGAGANGTISGLGAAGTASGPESVTFDGFGAYVLDAGGAWTLAGTNSLAAGQTLSHDGTLILAGALVNAGTILGGAGGDGLVMAAGAVLTNGGRAAPGAAIVGYFDGVLAATTTAATVTNFGTIRGTYLDGVQLAAGGLVTNGGPAATDALISGAYAGVYTLLGPTTVVNFGAIVGARAEGVELGAGGAVHNGRPTVMTALISGYFDGVYAYGAAASVTNFGTIQGIHGAGVLLTSGGSVVNGGAGGATALISGAVLGVYAYASAVNVTNFGTIVGAGSEGVDLARGGVVVNGAAGARAALISGATGVYVYAGAATVTNFGTIRGEAGVSVRFASSRDRLIDEAGSVFLGAVEGGGGTLELAAGGPGTIAGLGTAMAGFGSYVVDSGAAWTLTGANTLAAGARLVVAGVLTLTDKATLTLQGAIAGGGVIRLAAAIGLTRLIVGAGGATLSGGGRVILEGSAFDRIVGAAPGATLINIDDTIEGGGVLGNADLGLVNRAAGVIDQTGAVALAIATGATTLVNAGTIEATGTGGATIAGAVDNSGMLEALGGTLAVGGAVTGTGSAFVDGAALMFASSFTQNVRFGGEGGTLVLARSRAYAGTITGFSRTGATTLDLRDIAFVGAGEASFSGTSAGGVLTVTDGSHTARIALAGDYIGATWTASSDGAGGVLVSDPPAPETARPSPHAFTSAMAAVGAIVPSPGSAPIHAGVECRAVLLAPRA